jgi:hypothetical protein
MKEVAIELGLPSGSEKPDKTQTNNLQIRQKTSRGLLREGGQGRRGELA